MTLIDVKECAIDRSRVVVHIRPFKLLKTLDGSTVLVLCYLEKRGLLILSGGSSYYCTHDVLLVLLATPAAAAAATASRTTTTSRSTS